MDSFGSRLRYERERRQIALKSIAESTKIGITLLEGLERDDVSRWPSGIFRKSFIRSYAEAIGSEARSDRPRVRRTVSRSARGRTRRAIRRRLARRRRATAEVHATSCHHQSRSSGDQAHHHLERIGTSHHWKIGGLEDCQNVVGLAICDNQSPNLPICQSPNAECA